MCLGMQGALKTQPQNCVCMPSRDIRIWNFPALMSRLENLDVTGLEGPFSHTGPVASSYREVDSSQTSFACSVFFLAVVSLPASWVLSMQCSRGPTLAFFCLIFLSWFPCSVQFKQPVTLCLLLCGRSWAGSHRGHQGEEAVVSLTRPTGRW